eukprot:jgi/Botrbrau1/10890/Bobra.0025s0066.1
MRTLRPIFGYIGFVQTTKCLVFEISGTTPIRIVPRAFWHWWFPPGHPWLKSVRLVTR